MLRSVKHQGSRIELLTINDDVVNSSQLLRLLGVQQQAHLCSYENVCGASNRHTSESNLSDAFSRSHMHNGNSAGEQSQYRLSQTLEFVDTFFITS